MQQNDTPPAVPLWIDGHAFLTVTPTFQDVRDPCTGDVVRRVPLCGVEEVRLAIAVGRVALASWTGMPAEARATLLSAVGDLLGSYGGHFAGLISEESGKEKTLALAEVDESVALLRSALVSLNAGVVAIVGNSAMPLLSALSLAVPALLAGAVVVARPSPDTPSALFAFAELTTRCGIPNGVFNIVHGDADVVTCMRAITGVTVHVA